MQTLQYLTPSEKNNTITIPKKWYGKHIGVIFYQATPEPESGEKPTVDPKNKKPFVIDRRFLKTMRMCTNPAMMSDNLIRADRDAR